MKNKKSIGIILNNLIPFAGILFFSWKIAPVLFFFLLDSELSILELLGLVMLQISREKEGLFPKNTGKIKKFFYTVITYLILSIILSIPSFFAGIILYLLLKNYLSNPLKEIFLQREVFFGLAFNITIRGYFIFQNIKKPLLGSLKESAKEKYILLIYKSFGILFLGRVFSNSTSYISLYIFVFLLSIFFSIVEIKADIFLKTGSKSSKISAGK